MNHSFSVLGFGRTKAALLQLGTVNMPKSLLVKYLPFISLIFHRSTRSDPSVHFSVVVPDNVSWFAVNRVGMGCKGWLRGNSPAGLCFRAGLQAHPAVSRDCIAPEWTCGDGARADLLAAGRLRCGCLLDRLLCREQGCVVALR